MINGLLGDFIFIVCINSLFFSIILSFFLLEELEKKVISRKVYNSILQYRPLLSTIYTTIGSLNSLIRLIANEKDVFGLLSLHIRNMINRKGFSIFKDPKEARKDIVFGELIKIASDSYRDIDNWETYYDLLTHLAEKDKRDLETLDERISMLSFINYFFPFTIVFAVLMYGRYIDLLLIFLPFFNLISIYATFRLIGE